MLLLLTADAGLLLFQLLARSFRLAQPGRCDAIGVLRVTAITVTAVRYYTVRYGAILSGAGRNGE